MSQVEPQAPSETDRALLDRIAEGDPQAVTAFYERHVDGVYAFVFYRANREPAIAEDVVQDTFLQAIDAARDFDPARGTARAWLCTLSRNHLRKHRRASQRADGWAATRRELEEVLHGAPLSDELLSRSQTRDLVSSAVAELPDAYRELLLRKYIHGEPMETLASTLQLSLEATKSKLARARRAFRDVFEALAEETQLEKPR